MASEAEVPYSAVKLCIHKIILPKEKLSPTPSESDNLDPEMEYDLRILGCDFIQLSGILLKLPQVAMASAQILYQRFYFSKSFVRHYYEHYSMGCIFLAAKIEECPRRIRDIINVFHHLKQLKAGKPQTYMLLDQNYISLKNQVIKAERRILKELGFCVHGKHPHKLVICYLQALEKHTNEKLVQRSWNYMNDVLRTDVFVRYHPEAISCACIYLAARDLRVPLPNDPSWVEMLCVDEESVKEISLILLKIYKRPPPDLEKVEAKLIELRKAQTEARCDRERELELKRQQNKALTATTTPTCMAANDSSQNNSNTVSPAKHTSGFTHETTGEHEVNGFSGRMDDKKIETSSKSSSSYSQSKSKKTPAAFATNKNDKKQISSLATTDTSRHHHHGSSSSQKHSENHSRRKPSSSTTKTYRKGSTSSMSIDSDSQPDSNNNKNSQNELNSDDDSDDSSASRSSSRDRRYRRNRKYQSRRDDYKRNSSRTKGSHSELSPSRKKKAHESSKRYPSSPHRSNRKRKSSSPSSSSHTASRSNLIVINPSTENGESRPKSSKDSHGSKDYKRR